MNDSTVLPEGRRIVIHSDGACPGNPGPGGWGATIKEYDGPMEVRRINVTGTEPDQTTNIRMELRGAIEALRAVPPDMDDGTPIAVHCDNEVVIKGMTEWWPGWAAKGWRRAKGRVKNAELWQELVALAGERPITWHWVRGHAGDPHNEEVDRMASLAAIEAAAQRATHHQEKQ